MFCGQGDLQMLECLHKQGGLSQCGHFADKGVKGVNFSRFFADVFYGRPLNRALDVANAF